MSYNCISDQMDVLFLSGPELRYDDIRCVGVFIPVHVLLLVGSKTKHDLICVGGMGKHFRTCAWFMHQSEKYLLFFDAIASLAMEHECQSVSQS